MTLKYSILALFLAWTGIGLGQVKFTTHLSRHKLGVNERLRVEFKMNKNGDDFTPPAFKDFRVISGPMQTYKQVYSYGKRTFTRSYTFVLQPKKRGTLSIGQATVKIDGKTYKTSPKKVEVTAAVNKPKNGRGGQIVEVTKGIHLVTEVSNTHPYLNQGITVVYKLYVRKDAAVSNWHALDQPKFPNFWNQDIDVKKIKVKYGSYQGDKDYRYVVLKKTVLYPQKTGKLTIQPLTLDLAVEVPSNRRTIFGRRLTKTVHKTMASPRRTIDVKPLPQQGQPANFTGAVGQFSFKTTTTKNSLNADESFDVEVEVSGHGNLKLFSLPKLKVPKAFEAYDPEHNEQVSTSLSGMHGRISDTYTVVPKMKGQYQLKPLRFSYFDPKTGTYKELSSHAIDIKVIKGPSSPAGRPSNDSSAYALAHKQPVTTSGRHFRYNKLKANLQPLDRPAFFKSTLFWTLLFLPIVLLPVAMGVGNKRRAALNNVYGRRVKQADRLAKKYLSEAKKNIGDQQAYYDALERALHNYLKAKLDLSTVEMSKNRIDELLRKKGVSQETGKAFISLLRSCDFARYTPSSEVGMKQDYKKAAQIISQADKQMSKA